MITSDLEAKLIRLGQRLIDQERARVIVPAYAPETGFWFGGGNCTTGPDGHLYVVGRYRNVGDSRTGVAAGTRGLELAIFRSTNQGQSFEKVCKWSKQQLNVDGKHVLSIEGSALRFTPAGVALFVSTEKDSVGYPPQFAEFLKPGTGVWSIDCLRADSIATLESATVTPVLSSEAPESIHVKDPFLYEGPQGPLLFFCSHPFSWTCSCTGCAAYREEASSCDEAVFDFFPRGNVWDVAMSRGTCLIDVPRIGPFADMDVQLMFYDGGECVRNHDAHTTAVDRPRGYSCEELGGAAYFEGRQWHRAERLSRYQPLFVSPQGTGCSRYVDVHVRPEGMYATWQQSQRDGSQPLVLNFLPTDDIESILTS